MIELPVTAVITAFGALCTVITVLGKLIYNVLNDRIIVQSQMIDQLRAEISRLDRGCGVEGCEWRR